MASLHYTIQTTDKLIVKDYKNKSMCKTNLTTPKSLMNIHVSKLSRRRKNTHKVSRINRIFPESISKYLSHVKFKLPGEKQKRSETIYNSLKERNLSNLANDHVAYRLRKHTDKAGVNNDNSRFEMSVLHQNGILEEGIKRDKRKVKRRSKRMKYKFGSGSLYNSFIVSNRKNESKGENKTNFDNGQYSTNKQTSLDSDSFENKENTFETEASNITENVTNEYALDMEGSTESNKHKNKSVILTENLNFDTDTAFVLKANKYPISGSLSDETEDNNFMTTEKRLLNFAVYKENPEKYFPYTQSTSMTEESLKLMAVTKNNNINSVFIFIDNEKLLPSTLALPSTSLPLYPTNQRLKTNNTNDVRISSSAMRNYNETEAYPFTAKRYTLQEAMQEIDSVDTNNISTSEYLETEITSATAAGHTYDYVKNELNSSSCENTEKYKILNNINSTQYTTMCIAFNASHTVQNNYTIELIDPQCKCRNYYREFNRPTVRKGLEPYFLIPAKEINETMKNSFKNHLTYISRGSHCSSFDRDEIETTKLHSLESQEMSSTAPDGSIDKLTTATSGRCGKCATCKICGEARNTGKGNTNFYSNEKAIDSETNNKLSSIMKNTDTKKLIAPFGNKNISQNTTVSNLDDVFINKIAKQDPIGFIVLLPTNEKLFLKLSQTFVRNQSMDTKPVFQVVLVIPKHQSDIKNKNFTMPDSNKILCPSNDLYWNHEKTRFSLPKLKYHKQNNDNFMLQQYKKNLFKFVKPDVITENYSLYCDHKRGSI